jgi:hypothetical protein
MFDHRLRKAAVVLLLSFATAAPALAEGPAAEFKLDDKAPVFVSPDQQIRIEAYYKTDKDDNWLFQFWIFDRDHGHPFLLNPGEKDDVAGYAAGFRFSADSQWLVRGQKLGAGYQTLFLYRRDGDRFLPATKKPLGDMAWDYFFTTPTSKRMYRNPKDPYSMDHAFVALIEGMDDSYASLGQHWPENRYVVMSLSFDMQGEDRKAPWIVGWQCIYDLKTGKFSVPHEFAEKNAKSVRKPGDPPY